MSLFIRKNIVLHSGEVSDFKIECDSLTDDDLDCLAYLISKKIKFFGVHGIPNGGLKLAEKLEQYVELNSNEYLLVDDVFTTGNSMNKERESFSEKKFVKGVVIFARGKCPDWVTPIFQMFPTKDKREEPIEDKALEKLAEATRLKVSNKAYITSSEEDAFDIGFIAGYKANQSDAVAFLNWISDEDISEDGYQVRKWEFGGNIYTPEELYQIFKNKP